MELHYNGNGGAVNGRERHRKMTRSEALELAADIASGRPFEPSLHHLADIFGVPVGALGKAVKARVAAQEAPVEETAVGAAPAAEAEAVFNPPLGVVLDPPSGVALVNAWYAADLEEREWFVREVGTDAIWDVITQLIR